MQKRFEQNTITTYYRAWARPYRWLTPFYLLGNERRLRRKAVHTLQLQTGQ